MPVPRTVGELIDQTWPDAQAAHDIEIYLDQMWEEWGHKFPPERHGGHWVGAQDDIRRLAKKNAAAARRPRRPRKPATPAHTTSRVQLELPF